MAVSWRALGAAVCLLGGTAQASEIVLTLRSEVLLTQAQLRLGDIAEVSTADAARQQAWRQLPLGLAPLAGQLEQRGRAELDLVLHAQALAPGNTIVWRGASSVRLQRASQMLEGERLLELAQQQVRQVFAAPDLALEIRLAAPLVPLLAPAGDLQYQARLADASRLRARMAVWIDVTAQGTLYRSVLVPLAVQAYREVYVARRALPAGTLATAADFALRREDVAALAAPALVAGALDAGLRVRQGLAPGQVAGVRDMAGDDMVLRGERVRLVSNSAGIAIETSAYVQADAVVGQRVRVRPERSNETVEARVLASGLVSIEGR